MSYKYTYQAEVNPIVLADEIQASNITVALDYISTSGEFVDIFFKATLSVAEETELTTIVANHDPEACVKEDPLLVKVVEEDPDEEKSFQTITLGITVPAASGWHTQDHTFPLDISVISSDLLIKEENVGDKMEVLVAPDTIVGAVIQDVKQGDTEIFVQQSVLDHVYKGYYIKLIDQNKGIADVGRVLQKKTNSIVVEIPSQMDFSMAAPTYVAMTIKLFNDWEFPGAGRIDIGDAKIGASLIPANTIIRLCYWNRENVAKRFVAPLDILY